MRFLSGCAPTHRHHLPRPQPIPRHPGATQQGHHHLPRHHHLPHPRPRQLGVARLSSTVHMSTPTVFPPWQQGGKRLAGGERLCAMRAATGWRQSVATLLSSFQCDEGVTLQPVYHNRLWYILIYQPSGLPGAVVQVDMRIIVSTPSPHTPYILCTMRIYAENWTVCVNLAKKSKNFNFLIFYFLWSITNTNWIRY